MDYLRKESCADYTERSLKFRERKEFFSRKLVPVLVPVEGRFWVLSDEVG
jgi:hypothetical protein